MASAWNNMRIVVFDNDELSGSYGLVFSFLGLLMQLCHPDYPFIATVQRDLRSIGKPYTRENAIRFVVQSFARTFALIACPNGMMRPYMREFLLYTFKCKQQRLIDYVVMYTFAEEASDGEYRHLLQLFMSTMLASTIGVQDPELLFDDIITRNVQRDDQTSLQLQYIHGSKTPQSAYFSVTPNMQQNIRKSTSYVRMRLARKYGLSPSLTDDFSTLKEAFSTDTSSLIFFDDIPQSIKSSWFYSQPQGGDSLQFAFYESKRDYIIGVSPYHFAPTREQAMGLWYMCLARLSMELQQPSSGYLNNHYVKLLAENTIQLDTGRVVAMSDFVNQVLRDAVTSTVQRMEGRSSQLVTTPIQDSLNAQMAENALLQQSLSALKDDPHMTTFIRNTTYMSFFINLYTLEYDPIVVTPMDLDAVVPPFQWFTEDEMLAADVMKNLSESARYEDDRVEMEEDDDELVGLQGGAIESRLGAVATFYTNVQIDCYTKDSQLFN